MRKNMDERLDAVLDQIEDPAWQTTLFSGYNTDAVRDIVIDDLNDHWDHAAQRQLSDLLSLGGFRLIKSDSETKSRNLKRLALFFHRVPGYHQHEESMSLKRTILGQTYAEVLPRAKYEVQRALIYMSDEEVWAREVALRYGGTLVHYYNQGKDNRLEAWDITENGWCLGMSVHWLGCKAQKLEFWGSHMSEMGAAKYRFVMAAQGVRVARGETDDRASFRLKKFGLERKTIVRENADPSPARLATTLSRGASPFLRIGQYYVDGGGHAMAACLEKGGISFLDPNLGEFFFRSVGSFERWFPVFMRKMGYRLDEFYVEQYASGQPVPSDFLREALAGRRLAMGYDED